MTLSHFVDTRLLDFFIIEMGIASSKTHSAIDVKSHPRQTIAHHIRELRMDPFPVENEHSISWQIKDYSGHIRCYLTGCSLCDESNVFLEKVPDDEGVSRLALRRTLTSTKTISVKFRGKRNAVKYTI